MKINIKNKNVVVTGSSKGIGLQIAKDFSDYGCKVFINSRNKKNLNKAKKLIKNKKLYTFEANLKNSSDVLKFYNFVKKKN